MMRCARLGELGIERSHRRSSAVQDTCLVILACVAVCASATRLFGALPQDQKIGTLSIEAPLDAIEKDIAANKFSDARSPLNDYLKEHPQSARAHYDLGYVLFRTHEIGASIKEVSKSLQLNINDGEAHKILGLDCTIIGRYDLAEVEFQQAAKLEPGSAEIHYFLGRTYYTRGVYPLARQEFQTAIQQNPSYMKAYNNLGLTMEILGDNQAAIKDYTTALQLEEEQKLNSEWPYIYLSALYLRQEQPTDALAYAQKALTINPRSDLAYFQMARAYRIQGDWKNAADAVQSAIAINSQTPDFYYVLSLSLRKLGRDTESKQAMATFEKLQKQSAGAISQRRAHPPQEPMTAPD